MFLGFQEDNAPISCCTRSAEDDGVSLTKAAEKIMNDILSSFL